MTLRADEVLARANGFCEHWWRRNPPLDSPLFTLLPQKFREAEELECACREGRDVEWASDTLGRGWCSWLVFNLRFVQVFCPVCEREYVPEQCAVLDWSVYCEPRAALGGKRLICPRELTLYSCDTWVA